MTTKEIRKANQTESSTSRFDYICRPNLLLFADEMPPEVIEGETETVPNQSLTVNEILQKFQNGTLPDIGKDIYYEDYEVGYDDYNPTENPAWDLADATAYLERDIEIKNKNLSQKNATEHSDEKQVQEDVSEANKDD